MRKGTRVAWAVAVMMVFAGCETTLPNVANDLNDTVTDPGTGLVWQNEQIGHGTRDAAVAFCDDLTLDNITSWRLPASAESQQFHLEMNAKGDVPVQAFDRCTAEVTNDGYVRTLKGSQQYGGKPGDPINFTGGANIRCVSDGGNG